MTVGELKALLAEVPDDFLVVVCDTGYQVVGLVERGRYEQTEEHAGKWHWVEGCFTHGGETANAVILG